MRTARVKDPKATVIVRSLSKTQLVIPCEDGQDVHLVEFGDKGRMSWADYVYAKNRPGFGRFIELDDSVTITKDGLIQIAETGTKLTEESMVDLLVLGAEQIKEDIITMNDGEKLLFRSFLNTRVELDIESDKCSALLKYMDTLEGKEEEVVEAAPEPPKDEKPKRRRGRPRKKKEVELKESEDSLAIQARKKDTQDSEE